MGCHITQEFFQAFFFNIGSVCILILYGKQVHPLVKNGFFFFQFPDIHQIFLLRLRSFKADQELLVSGFFQVHLNGKTDLTASGSCNSTLFFHIRTSSPVYGAFHRFPCAVFHKNLIGSLLIQYPSFYKKCIFSQDLLFINTIFHHAVHAESFQFFPCGGKDHFFLTSIRKKYFQPCIFLCQSQDLRNLQGESCIPDFSKFGQTSGNISSVKPYRLRNGNLLSISLQEKSKRGISLLCSPSGQDQRMSIPVIVFFFINIPKYFCHSHIPLVNSSTLSYFFEFTVCTP